jgi:hypothetical protein
MLIPNKHENLNESLIALGSEILKKTNGKKVLLEELFNQFKTEHKNLHIDNFFLTLIFLWLIDTIKMESSLVMRK